MLEQQLKSIPIGVASWSVMRDNNLLYVDKTAKLGVLVSKHQKVFLSRPRRMGKSLLCSMLKDLFTNGDTNFAGTAIYGNWPITERYPVIHLSFIDIRGDNLEIALKAALKSAFSKVGFAQANDLELEQPFNGFLKSFDKITQGHKLVFLIDEWDFPLSIHLDNEEEFKKSLSTLSIFYSWLRNIENYQYILITGIMRYRDASLFTGRDILDISMRPKYADLLGYTQEDLVTNFAPYIELAAQRLKLTKDELLAKLEKHYDGFCFDYNAKVKVYCPDSINSFFEPIATSIDDPDDLPNFNSYWMDSSNATAALRSYLHRYKSTPNNILQMCSYDVKIKQSDITSPTKFNNITKTQILFQSGLVSLKNITSDTINNPPDKRSFICRLTNYDVAAKYTAVLTSYMLGIDDSDAYDHLTKVQNAILADDINSTCLFINELLCGIHYDFMASAKEMHYRTLIALWLRSDVINVKEDVDASTQKDVSKASLKETAITVQEEVPNNLGRIDLLITTKNHIYVVELKRLSKNTDTKEAKLRMLDKAEQQILDKCYLNNIKTEGRLVSSVQIVVSDKYRQIAAWRRSNKIVGMQQELIKMDNVRTK